MPQRKRQRAVVPVTIDPTLERKWQAALLSRPDGSDPTALAAWNDTNCDLLTQYQRAIDHARSEQRLVTAARMRLRRRIVTVVAAITIASGGIIYWSNQPSEDDLLEAQYQQRNAACAIHYEQAHHLQLVAKQVDLLGDNEGGWIDLSSYTGESSAGNINLSPAELQTGQTGTATVNREAYVHESRFDLGYTAALLERHGSQLTLTLPSYPSGYGEIPRGPLQAPLTVQVTVRGEEMFKDCR